MATVERPSTSCQTHRPSLADDEPQATVHRQNSLSRSQTFDNGHVAPPRQPSRQQQQRSAKLSPTLPTPAEPPSNRLARNLLSNENWRQETMADVRLNAKAIEQSDQNILFGKGKSSLDLHH